MWLVYRFGLSLAGWFLCLLVSGRTRGLWMGYWYLFRALGLGFLSGPRCLWLRL
ncbi:uncharacterized protein BDW43DRAFT_295363, partial [Aspergillus alliaceus]|uniref:uncharacterized protein n=1 Tax=Petromyces alliaceus TaxID=209559 RepID=UPI0012A66E1C